MYVLIFLFKMRVFENVGKFMNYGIIRYSFMVWDLLVLLWFIGER